MSSPLLILVDFYPRPPRGGRPPYNGSMFTKSFISIHALREEGDLDFYYPVFANLGISIHALREEGDLAKFDENNGTFISIHALREEGDQAVDTITKAIA